MGGRHEATFAVQLLAMGRFLAWRTDLSWLRTERLDGARDDLRVQSQLQLRL